MRFVAELWRHSGENAWHFISVKVNARTRADVGAGEVLDVDIELLA